MTVRIKNWSKHQHFKDRTPPWIKLYRDILDDPDWHELSGDDAKMLVNLWLIASEDETRTGELPNARRIAFRLRIKESQVNQALARLSHWLIQDDINVISTRHQVDAPEESRGETETKGETGEKPPRKRDAHTDVLKPDDLDAQIWADWLTLRKAKRLPLTQTAWADTKAEGAKVGLTPAQTVSHAVRSNWAGFRAAWYERDAIGKPSFAQQAADIARTTVPGRPGRDPVLLEIERHAKQGAAPIPENIRQQMAKLKGGVLQ